MTTRAELRATGAFTDYTDGELDVLVSVSTERRFAPKSDLCREGTVGAACYCIVSGAVDVIKRMPAGDAAISALGPGAIAGQIALVHRVPRTATLRARNDVVALEFSRDTFERLLGASSPLALRFQRQIAVAGIRQLRSTLKRVASVMGEHEPPQPGSARPQPAPSTRPRGDARISTIDALTSSARWPHP
jgi:CRP-like cAMP-binding protein